LTLGEAGRLMDEDESIRRNLARLFTARRGSAPIADDYGLPELNDLSLSRAELVAGNCRAMTACIRKYEPRLLDPVVREKPDTGEGFMQGYLITAQKRDGKGRPAPWRWELALENGRVRNEP
jgi:type VI secretion system protein